MKNENLTASDGCDTIGHTLNRNEPMVSNDIIDVKQWYRECPICKRVRFYSSRKTYFTTLKRNTICKSCSNRKNAIGKSPTEETRKKLSEAISGHKNYHFGKPGTNLGKKFSASHRLKISSTQKGRKWNPDFRAKMMKIISLPEHREACRLGAIKRMLKQRLNGNIHARSYNADACDYFNELNQKNGWELQHAGNGGEIECHGYFLDAYDETQNIVVEYDESRHYKLLDNNWILSSKDVQRMTDIKKYLNYRFYRYNEQTQKFLKY